MKKMVAIIKVGFLLLAVTTFLYCNLNKSYKNNPLKIQLLLEDILKKEDYFPVFKGWTVDFNSKTNTPPDSSMYFAYLYSRNLKIPDKEFYLHWDNELVPSYPDSIKLRIIRDYSEMDAIAYTVSVNVLEVNMDSTKMKVGLDYGLGGRVFDKGVFTYLFDEHNYKWVALDSTITYSKY